MSIRYTQIKSEKELGELSKYVSLQMLDNKVEAVVVNINGQEIRIVKDGTYSDYMRILCQAPKKEITKYRITGKYMDVADVLVEGFNSKKDAEEVLEDYRTKSNCSWNQDIGLRIEEYSVWEDEDKIG